MPRRVEEAKIKDFKKVLKDIFKNLKAWRYILIISCVLSMIASILSTIAPNRLAKVTDVITDGIKPNVEVLQEISEKIIINSKNNKYEVIVINDVEITPKDQIKFIELSKDFSKTKDNEELITKLNKLPKSIKKLVDAKMNTTKLQSKITNLGLIYLIQALLAYIVGIAMAYVGIGFSKNLREQISTKINRLPLKYFDSHETGDILSRVTNDVDTIGINMSSDITSFVTNITLFLGSIIMMFVTNWIMALTAILSSILGFALSFIILKRSQKYFVNRQKYLGELNGHIEEIYSGHNVVKAYNGEMEALEEFDKINDKLYECNRKSQFLSGIMQPLMHFIGNFGYVAVCVVGIYLVMNKMADFGVIVAFMIYVRLFTNPLSRIAQATTTLQSIAAAAERVFEFLEEEELTDETKLTEKLKVEDVNGSIEFKNVKFGYNPDRTIIKDFSAKVNPGEKVAIVGPTGAGKTTMVNLLMKFYEITSGDILIDNKSIKELSRENIHSLFTMVLQDTWLFDGTIKENIKFNKKSVSDEEVWDACRTVGIDHFIKTLPKGIHAKVEDNDSISSGQKQLLTIARGMIEDAPFLILDEATSNVDTRTEELVQIAMDKLSEGKTSFIIAHRLSTIKNADLILVMDEGNIIEQGTHDSLLKLNGFYAELYNSQFRK